MAELTEQEKAVEALARTAVAQVSPAELPLFRATAARYRDDPDGTLAPRSAGGDTLGFGASAAVVLITPFALELVKRVFVRIADKLGESAADSLAGRVSAWFTGKADRPPGEPDPEPLTREQLALVAETTRAEAAELELPPAEQERLADAVVASLATRT